MASNRDEHNVESTNNTPVETHTNEQMTDSICPSCKITFKWLQTKPGLLKLFQLGILLSSMITISSSKYVNEQATYPCVVVFWAVLSVSISFSLTAMLIYSMDVSTKLPTILQKPVVKMALSSIGILLLMSSSAWLISTFYHESNAVMSGLLGIFAGFMFVVENMFYIATYVKHVDWRDGNLVYTHIAQGLE